jgi:hypothetical protein
MSIINTNDLTQYDAKVDGVTFDPNYTWAGSTGSGSGSGSTSTAPADAKGTPFKYYFEEVTELKPAGIG